MKLDWVTTQPWMRQLVAVQNVNTGERIAETMPHLYPQYKPEREGVYSVRYHQANPMRNYLPNSRHGWSMWKGGKWHAVCDDPTIARRIAELDPDSETRNTILSWIGLQQEAKQ